MRSALVIFARRPLARALLVTVVAAGAALLMASASASADRSAVAAHGGPLSAQVALDWNTNAVTAIRAATTLDGVPFGGSPRSFFQIEGLIYLSYVQAAVYDAVTKIEHRYEPYHRFPAAAGHASAEAAVVAAAYATLTFYLGDPGGALAAKYAASIAALPPDAETARGIAVGQAAAADIEALRANDGRNAATAVYGAIGPVVAGAWQVVPPSTFAQTPWVAFMQPFMTQSVSQFRTPPPPAMTSAQYATDFNETKMYGSSTSAVRSSTQTSIAWFWNANTINQQNQLYRDLSGQHTLDLVDTARLLAMGNLTAADAGIACFDSKYHWLHWRPYTAIRNAGLDGNAATVADPAWTPLIATPNHPEYPSAHGCVTSAVTRAIADVLGTNAIDVTIMGALPGGSTLATSQHFATVDDVQRQVVDARTWAGLHWRNSSVAGVNLGNALAGWASERYFQPLGPGRGNAADEGQSGAEHGAAAAQAAPDEDVRSDHRSARAHSHGGRG
jgi:hypothetical protein